MTLHKAPAEPIEAIGNAKSNCVLDTGHGLWQARIMGVVNHPQSLWISLWRSFRGRRQVPLAKGFFFFCSNFER